MIITPYMKIDGIRTFPDSFIYGVYRQLVEDGTNHRLFYDGTVRNEYQFLSLLKRPDSEVYFFMDTEGCFGLFWLNARRQKTAYIHFAFFRRAWGRKSVEAGRYALKTLLSAKDRHGDYYNEVIYGLTPESNRLAVRYTKMVGAKLLGVVPDCVHDEYDGTTTGAVHSYNVLEGL